MMWMGEQITDKGIGNGISLIIFIGIIDRFPYSIFDEIRLISAGQRSIIIEIIILAFMFFIIAGVVLVTQGTQKNSCSICKKSCWKKSLWRSNSVYSFKSKYCWCYAYYICSVNYVYSKYSIYLFFLIMNFYRVLQVVFRLSVHLFILQFML